MSENTLKIAVGQYVDQFGTTQNAFVTWSGADINYGEAGSVRFACYENEAESARNNRKCLFVMPITAAEILEMFTRSGLVAVEISEASWDLAQTVKFVPSRVIENNIPKMVLLSLAELGFQIVDVPLPEMMTAAMKTGRRKK